MNDLTDFTICEIRTDSICGRWLFWVFNYTREGARDDHSSSTRYGVLHWLMELLKEENTGDAIHRFTLRDFREHGIPTYILWFSVSLCIIDLKLYNMPKFMLISPFWKNGIYTLEMLLKRSTHII